MTTGSIALVSRWTARVWSILSVVFILIFVVGEGMGGGGPRPSPKEWVGLALFPIGVCVGLAAAWFRERWGGILAFGCLIAFYTWDRLLSGHWPRGPFSFLVAAPGLLFLLAGFLSAGGAGSHQGEMN
jgi:hypothetical protein